MTIKNYILKETGCTSFSQLKQKLDSLKKFEYGCYMSEIKCKSFRVFYTSNPNHFCNYGISLNGIGMSQTLGLDKNCITAAGKQRGCTGYYLTKEYLNKTKK